MWKQKGILANYLIDAANKNFVYYGYGYFGKILNFKSYFHSENIKESTGDKYIYVNEDYDRDVFVALMNSTLFYWFYVNYSDGHNFTRFVIGSIPFVYPNKDIVRQLKNVITVLMKDLSNNANRKIANYKATGKVEYDEYFPKKSKSIINKIDKIFAKHYGFTDEELNYIINYDIKYRMGDFLNGDNNDEE